MPINNPTALVEEFKKSGEFDRLRRELLTQFQQDPSFVAFRGSVEDIARKRIANDHERLQYLSSDVVLKELTQEVQRYPIVERAASNVRSFSDSAFLDGVQKSMQKILQYEKGSTASISKATEDGLEIGTKRIEVTQSSVHQPEKTVQEAHGSNILSEHPPPVGESHEQSLLPTADNPGEVGPEKMPIGQDNSQANGSGVVTNSSAVANESTSEPSVDAEISNNDKALERQQQTQKHVEIANVRAGD